MQVLMRRKCHHCGGTGIVQSYKWAIYYAGVGTPLDSSPPSGPEEKRCPACDGTSWIEVWRPLPAIAGPVEAPDTATTVMELMPDVAQGHTVLDNIESRIESLEYKFRALEEQVRRGALP